MESVFQILAVLTKHSTNFLCHKNERDTSIVELGDRSEINDNVGSSVGFAQDTNTIQTERDTGKATQSSSKLTTDSQHLPTTDSQHLPTTDSQHLPTTDSQHLPTTDSQHPLTTVIRRDESIDAVTNALFDQIIKQLDSDTSLSNSSNDSSVTLSLASSVFDKLADQLESASDVSLDRKLCRICYGSEEAQLLSMCHCKGSIASVHLHCMERWLQECGMDTCDLCNYKFITVRKPTQSKLSSLLTWVTHADSQEDMEELLSDVAVTFLFSPFVILLTLSGYETMVTRTISMFVRDVDHKLVFSLPGTLATLSLFAFLSLVNSIGLSWLCYVGHKHYSRWQAWYMRSTIVRIHLPESMGGLSLTR